MDHQKPSCQDVSNSIPDEQSSISSIPTNTTDLFQDALVNYYSHLMNQVHQNIVQMGILRVLQNQQDLNNTLMYSEDIQQQQQSIVPQLEVNKIPEVEKSSDQLETHSNQNQHGDRICSNCFAVKTPLWRRDPKSGGHLCNACGLYQRNNCGSARPLERPKNTRVTSSKHKGKKCFNCQAEKTTLWRQITEQKITVCNACGLYYNLHNEHRPSHLIKKNFIQTRNRKNKKVQGGCDEEQNVGDVDLNNVLHID